ncbi:MAG: peptidylprolyl isomerase [Deltaproteobacteria bacterium]|nr:peptidylprolyl isomerase [Deltaproteobacteria bacterium]
MKVAAKCVVSLDYSLHLGDGAVVDTSAGGEPLTYMHGTGQIIPGLEKQLEGMDVGETRQLVVPPADGYGELDPASVQEVTRNHFGDRELKAGDEFVAIDDQHHEIPVRIQKVTGDMVTVDFNHPLAGKTLHFSVTVKDVRVATAEELSHGHAHHGDGHHH